MTAVPSEIARRRLVATLLASLAAMPARASITEDFLDSLPAVDDEQLSAVRGGFETGAFNISFAVDRAVMVNGEVVSVQRLVIDRVADLLAGKAPSVQVVGNALTVVQNGPGNVVPAGTSVQSAVPSAAQISANSSGGANGALASTLSQVQSAVNTAQAALGSVAGISGSAPAAATATAGGIAGTGPAAMSPGSGAPAVANAPSAGALGTLGTPPNGIAGPPLPGLPSAGAISAAVNDQVQAAIAAAQSAAGVAANGRAASAAALGASIQAAANAAAAEALANASRANAAQVNATTAASGGLATVGSQAFGASSTPPLQNANGATQAAGNPLGIASPTPPTPPSVPAPPNLSGTASTTAASTIPSPGSFGPAQVPTAASAPLTQTLVVQTGIPGQPLVLNNIPNGAAIATAVQNSLNNQLLQVHTQISAQLNALEVARSGALAAALRQQALDALRR